jgi:hypothetical protein
MFLVNSIPARVLFDSGASHSFVTENFVTKGKLESTMMPRAMLVQIPGSIMKTKRNCIDVPVDIHGVSFKANLIILMIMQKTTMMMVRNSTMLVQTRIHLPVSRL